MHEPASISPTTSLRLSGIVPPMVTPLSGRDVIDHDGTARLVEHLIAGGVSGLFILGTTGEAPSLSYRLRGELIRTVCSIVQRRVPVLVGVTDTSFVESVAMAKIAAAAHADAVVLAMPYYFPAGQTELVRYVRSIVPELSLPVMLYNMPSLTKVHFDIESLQQLTDLPQIMGVKDSGGDLEYYQRLTALKQQRPDWSFLIGPEHLMAESLSLGGDGGVNGGANIFPKLFVRCYQATRDGDRQHARALQAQIEKLQGIYSVGKYASRFIKGTKSALSILGICDDKLAEPFNHFLEPERQKVAAVLQTLDTALVK